MLLVTLSIKSLVSISQNGFNPKTLNKQIGNHLNRHIINASTHIRHDGDIGGEIEMNGQWQKFVEVEKVGVGDHWHMKDECELVLCRVLEV